MRHVSNLEKKYHRNGITGAPFWAIEFTFWEDGEGTDLIAVVLDEDKFDNEKYCVLTRDDIFEGWRGDDIGELLVSLCDFDLE
jgi:hypothetical protein